MSDRTRERPFSAVAQLLRRDDLFASAGAGEALAAFVARQSLACFGQRPAGGLNANVLDTGNAVAQPQASMARNGDRWKFKLTLDASAGFSCADVSYAPEKGEMKDMSMQVFERLDWQPVRVKTAAGLAMELPLLPRFIVATGGVSGLGFKHGSVPAATSPDPHPLWRVESTHDCSVIVAFGYVIDRAARTVVVMPPTLAQAADFSARLQSRQIDGQSNVDMAVVIAELVLCRPKDDFDPYGGTFAARCFPLGSVFLNFEADIEWTLNATRPKKSEMGRHTHMDLTQMESSFAVRGAFFSDKNDGITSLPGGPPLPNWDNLFAYYNTGGTAGVTNKSFNVVTGQPERARAGTVSRRKDATSSVAVELRKVARQGAYDNVHVAPLMLTTAGDAVFMAPICQHDCLHTHWRWSSDYPADSPFHPIKGWGPNGPNTVAGAPMIPLNQTLQVGMKQTFEMVYRATASAQPAGQWAVFMHHGNAYVDRVALKATIAPLFEHFWASINVISFGGIVTGIPLIARVALPLALWRNDWANMYYGLRYLEDGTERLDLQNLSSLEVN